MSPQTINANVWVTAGVRIASLVTSVMIPLVLKAGIDLHSELTAFKIAMVEAKGEIQHNRVAALGEIKGLRERVMANETNIARTLERVRDLELQFAKGGK